MGTNVDHRPRKSTLSKIGKMFGVSDKNSIIPEDSEFNVAQQTNHQTKPASEDHYSQQPSQQNTNPYPSSKSSSSPAHSNGSSLNSSNSSLNQMTEFDKNGQKTPTSKMSSSSKPSSRPPSRPPSRASSIKLKSVASNTNMNTINGQSLNENLAAMKLKPPRSPPTNNLSNEKLNQVPNNVQLSRSSSTASNSNGHTGGVNGGSNANNAHSSKQIPRFQVFEDGTHEHHLKNAKRQEKLSNMLKNLLGAQKLRDEAVSAVPEILSNNPPSLFSGLVNQFSNNRDENVPFSGATRVQGLSNASQSTTNLQKNNETFHQRYGRCQEVVGKGTFGVVRISHKKQDDKETLFAVKEFKRKPNESDSKYSRRLTSEFCISSSLKHINIIETLDLLQDAKGDYVEVMEYCPGGDLYTLIIAAGKLEYLEADCFFKQLIRGVVYMHDMGVAHRDLKPENLLLTENGTIKITDFGNGECFKMAWEDEVHLSEDICGSSPYIAPEEYQSKEFDPRLVDIWACGVIYMAMRTGRHLWRTATQDDEFFKQYLEGRKSTKGYEPIEHLKRARCRNVIYSILDPIPSRRINGRQILNSEWGREIKCCVSNNKGPTTQVDEAALAELQQRQQQQKTSSK